MNNDKCEFCKGTGKEPGEPGCVWCHNTGTKEGQALLTPPGEETCDTCHGQGEVYTGTVTNQGYNQPPEPDMETCPECSGDQRWYVARDIDSLVRELDVLLNGEDAAPKAQLCDIVAQVAATKQRQGERVALLHKCREWIEAARDGVLYPIARDFDGVVGRNAEGLGQETPGLLDAIDAALSASAEPSAPKCKTCNGTGMVDDGEITCSEGGIPYENGPVKCVKGCPDCAPVERDERAENAERYLFLRNMPLEQSPGRERCLSVSVEDWSDNLAPSPAGIASCGAWSSMELRGEDLDTEVDKARAALERKP